MARCEQIYFFDMTRQEQKTCSVQPVGNRFTSSIWPGSYIYIFHIYCHLLKPIGTGNRDNLNLFKKYFQECIQGVHGHGQDRGDRPGALAEEAARAGRLARPRGQLGRGGFLLAGDGLQAQVTQVFRVLHIMWIYKSGKRSASWCQRVKPKPSRSGTNRHKNAKIKKNCAQPMFFFIDGHHVCIHTQILHRDISTSNLFESISTNDPLPQLPPLILFILP